MGGWMYGRISVYIENRLTNEYVGEQICVCVCMCVRARVSLCVFIILIVLFFSVLSNTQDEKFAAAGV